MNEFYKNLIVALLSFSIGGIISLISPRILKKVLNKITSKITRPVTCIIGGSKISTKIKIISNLIKDFDNIIIVGGMGNAMLKNTGVDIGKSVCDEGYKDLVEEILKKSKTHNCQIYYPLDVVVSKELNGNGMIKEVNEVNNGWNSDIDNGLCTKPTRWTTTARRRTRWSSTITI